MENPLQGKDGKPSEVWFALGPHPEARKPEVVLAGCPFRKQSDTSVLAPANRSLSQVLAGD